MYEGDAKTNSVLGLKIHFPKNTCKHSNNWGKKTQEHLAYLLLMTSQNEKFLHFCSPFEFDTIKILPLIYQPTNHASAIKMSMKKIVN